MHKVWQNNFLQPLITKEENLIYSQLNGTKNTFYSQGYKQDYKYSATIESLKSIKEMLRNRKLEQKEESIMIFVAKLGTSNLPATVFNLFFLINVNCYNPSRNDDYHAL